MKDWNLRGLRDIHLLEAGRRDGMALSAMSRAYAATGGDRASLVAFARYNHRLYVAAMRRAMDAS